MTLDYNLLEDSTEELGKSPRNQLRQIIENRSTAWVPASYLIHELESNSGSLAEGERILDQKVYLLMENDLKLTRTGRLR